MLGIRHHTVSAHINGLSVVWRPETGFTPSAPPANDININMQGAAGSSAARNNEDFSGFRRLGGGVSAGARTFELVLDVRMVPVPIW